MSTEILSPFKILSDNCRKLMVSCLTNEVALKSMDEYAKQQSIAFAEWIERNLWIQNSDKHVEEIKRGLWYQIAGTYEHNPAHYTTDQLYTIFLKLQK